MASATDDDEITPDGWVEQVRALGERGRVIAVEGQLAVAEGVEWVLPFGVSVSAAGAIIERVARAAETLRGTRRQRDRAPTQELEGVSPFLTLLYRRAFEELGLGPPIERSSRNPYSGFVEYTDQNAPGAACAALGAQGLTVQYAHDTWLTSHAQGVVSSEYARIPFDALPIERSVVLSTVRTLSEAAQYMNARPLRTCRFCGGTFSPIDLHDRTTCHGCAERHLGVVH